MRILNFEVAGWGSEDTERPREYPREDHDAGNCYKDSFCLTFLIPLTYIALAALVAPSQLFAPNVVTTKHSDDGCFECCMSLAWAVA